MAASVYVQTTLLVTKLCQKCSKERPAADFAVSKRAKSGLQTYCRECISLWGKANADLRAAQSKARRQANPEREKENAAAYYEANKLAVNAKRRSRYLISKEKEGIAVAAWKAANRPKIEARRKTYYLESKDAYKARHVKYYSENKHLYMESSARRRANKLNATSVWANKEAIAKIYAEAARITRATGIRHEVDHIVPLQGRNVCGLHCEANLQIITMTENRSKSFKWAS